MSDILDKAIDAAGGMKRWREIETIDVRLSLTGALFDNKALGGIENILMHIDTRRPAVDTSPYSGVGHVGHYTEAKTWITDGAGKVVEERADPRSAMLGAKAPNASLKLFAAAGHGFLFQHAEEFAGDVGRFLDGADNGAEA